MSNATNHKFIYIKKNEKLEMNNESENLQI